MGVNLALFIINTTHQYNPFGYKSSFLGSSSFRYSNTNRQNHFPLLSNIQRNLPLVKMHQHVMMLHAKYTILYIKVQCHNGLTL